MIRIVSCAILMFFALVVPGVAAEKVVVIVNKANTNQVDKATVEKIYQAKKLRWTGGDIQVVELPDKNPATRPFYANAVGRTQAETKEMWSLKLFTGMGIPPKVVQSEAEVKKIVAENKNAIGYVRASEVDGSVKVAFSVE